MTTTTSAHSYSRVSWWFKSVCNMQRKNMTDTSYAWPLRSHVQQPSAKFLLSQNWAPAPGIKSWPPSDRPVRPSSWVVSFSLQQITLKQGWTIRQSSYWTSRFTGPHKSDIRLVQIKACPYDQNDTILNRHSRKLIHWNLGIVMTSPHICLSSFIISAELHYLTLA
jgi:hypothetical protein